MCAAYYPVSEFNLEIQRQITTNNKHKREIKEKISYLKYEAQIKEEQRITDEI